MKSITKGAECVELRRWKKLNVSTPENINYDNLGSQERTPILDALIKEQGGLCAYTMCSISGEPGNWRAHIEHILPRSAYPGQTSVDWPNLVACIPTGNQCCEYGAHRKGAYDAGAKPFVNPVGLGVTGQFRFRMDGEVQGLTPTAQISISENVLNLNHPRLVNDRRAKIQGALDKTPSASQALQRAAALRKSGSNGFLEPYCEAVAQVLEAYASRLQRRSTRLSGAKRK